METIIKLMTAASLLLVQLTSFAGEEKARQEVKFKLSKEGSYEYNLVGKRLMRPMDEVLFKQLVANPEESANHDFVLSPWLLRIAAESNRQYLWLLKNKALRNEGEPDDLLLAYDYNVNGNQQALETLLKRARKSVEDGRSWGSARIYALGAVAEWDLCRKVLGSRSMSADGAGGDVRYGFWLTRRYFFPDSKNFPKDYDEFCRDLEQLQAKAEQDDARQPATAPESKPEGNSKLQPDSEVRSQ